MKYGDYSLLEKIRYYTNKYFFSKIYSVFNIILLNIIFITNPICSNNKSKIEIHTLLCKRDISIYLCAIKSFVLFSKLNPEIIIHDDGSLNSYHQDLIQRHIIGARIISRESADNLINNKLKKYKSILDSRKNNILLLKLIDINFFSKSDAQVILLDSDIFFRRPPKEIMDWCKSNSKKILYTQEPNYWVISKEGKPFYLRKEFEWLNVNLPKSFNAGLLCYKSGIIDYELLEKYCQITKGWENSFWIEQSFYAIICALNESEALPTEYLNKHKFKIKNPISRHHYDSKTRFNYFYFTKDLLRIYGSLLLKIKYE